MARSVLTTETLFILNQDYFYLQQNTTNFLVQTKTPLFTETEPCPSVWSIVRRHSNRPPCFSTKTKMCQVLSLSR